MARDEYFYRIETVVRRIERDGGVTEYVDHDEFAYESKWFETMREASDAGRDMMRDLGKPRECCGEICMVPCARRSRDGLDELVFYRCEVLFFDRGNCWVLVDTFDDLDADTCIAFELSRLSWKADGPFAYSLKRTIEWVKSLRSQHGANYGREA